jgi:hypothetical protein
MHFYENGVVIRVTILGEFSPIGRFFFGQFLLKISEVAQIWGYFFRGKNCT